MSQSPNQTWNQASLYAHYLQQEAGFDATKLAFLDQGIAASPYHDQVAAYPQRLQILPADHQPPNFQFLSTPWQDYPHRGHRPVIHAIDPALDLHPVIQQACVCFGKVSDGKVQTQWFGDQALDNVEFWSTTKILPLLYVVAAANTQLPTVAIDSYQIRSRGSTRGYPFAALADDVISYAEQIATSNAIAHTFKLFATPVALEQWVQSITGNWQLTFRGRYGEPPFLSAPELVTPQGQPLLQSAVTEHRGHNSVSAYDLTRMITLLGWHHHLMPTQRLPAAQWHSLSSLVRSLGIDSARYLDLAFATLGLQPVEPVILSKMGFGRSTIRDRTELCYTAFLQFRHAAPASPTLYTLGFTFLAALDLGDPDQEARELDAHIATTVTQLIQQLIQ